MTNCRPISRILENIVRRIDSNDCNHAERQNFKCELFHSTSQNTITLLVVDFQSKIIGADFSFIRNRNEGEPFCRSCQVDIIDNIESLSSYSLKFVYVVTA